MEKLIADLKREVKQIAEEAVTRKFIHADSTSITSLSAVVDAIVHHGLKRRAGGILPPYDAETMLLKLAEESEAAEKLVRKFIGMDTDDNIFEDSRQPVSPNEAKKTDFKIKKLNLDHTKVSYGKNSKFLWIRVALVEKLLAQIIASLVEQSVKFYESTAILADPFNGPLVANLLAGPCALDYSKMKTPDARWSDPSADELVRRHRIHSGLSLRRKQTSLTKPQLAGSSPTTEEFVVAPMLAREHVESLHQNADAVMLYGKNNVELQPSSGSEWVLGYLSLHQNTDSLLLKWTPNEVMSGSPDERKFPESTEAITIDTLDVVYVHCHHKGVAERVMILIAQDGVQRPPIRFPTTGSLMHFLEALESGLDPYGRLDPPLVNENGTGSLFDNLSQGKELANPSMTRDYVFRLVPSIRPEDIGLDSNLNLWTTGTTSKKKSPKKKRTRKTTSKSTKSSTPSNVPKLLRQQKAGLTKACLETVCETMKHQILYRALKGWLSHVRHLSTVRKHLSNLIHPKVVENEEETRTGVTEEQWRKFYQNEKLIVSEAEVATFVYHGGIQQEIRSTLWPYLLGYHKFGSTAEERAELDKIRTDEYNRSLAEWSRVEEFIHQRNSTSEIDGDSSADSAGSKEDLFNEDDDIHNKPSTPDQDSLLNGELTNGFNHHEDNDNFKNSISELDNESGCFDCGEEINRKLNSSIEKCSLCGLDISHVTNGGGGIVNGCLSNGGTVCSCKRRNPRLSSYSDEMLDNFGLNIHRIDKDVLRCDRNYPYFTIENLDKLRRIMCTYVWNTLDIGYVQGMCDLLAPLLVIFNDEAKSYHCFVLLMNRVGHNFPHGGAMDKHFANMGSLIQILDPELFEVMQQNGDLTHCYFCYRWFLLDFKREFEYNDIFRTWECIWAAQICSSKHFVLFIALALLKSYRNILIDHSMDFTDIIKFFNEMAECHNATQILEIARVSVKQVEMIIQNE